MLFKHIKNFDNKHKNIITVSIYILITFAILANLLESAITTSDATRRFFDHVHIFLLSISSIMLVILTHTTSNEEVINNEEKLDNNIILSNTISKNFIKTQYPEIEDDDNEAKIFVDQQNCGIYQQVDHKWKLISTTDGNLIQYKGRLYPKIEGLAEVFNDLDSLVRKVPIKFNKQHNYSLNIKPVGIKAPSNGLFIEYEISLVITE